MNTSNKTQGRDDEVRRPVTSRREQDELRRERPEMRKVVTPAGTYMTTCRQKADIERR